MTTITFGETRGSSSVADEIAKALGDVGRYLQKNHSGTERLIRGELAEVQHECSEPDWDGHDAHPVSYDSIIAARHFLLALPFGTPLPSVGIVPSGNVTLSWHHSRRRNLTISFSPDGDIHYAALVGPGRQSGTEPFYGEIPNTVLQLLDRVYPC